MLGIVLGTAMEQHLIQWGGGEGGGGERATLLVASCYRNQDKLWPDGPLGLYADLTFGYTLGSGGWGRHKPL